MLQQEINFWIDYVEKTARRKGEYYYPIGQKENEDYWSEITYNESSWQQTLYDASNDHSIVTTKKYHSYREALNDDSIYPNPNAVSVAYNFQLY